MLELLRTVEEAHRWAQRLTLEPWGFSPTPLRLLFGDVVRRGEGFRLRGLLYPVPYRQERGGTLKVLPPWEEGKPDLADPREVLMVKGEGEGKAPRGFLGKMLKLGGEGKLYAEVLPLVSDVDDHDLPHLLLEDEDWGLSPKAQARLREGLKGLIRSLEAQVHPTRVIG